MITTKPWKTIHNRLTGKYVLKNCVRDRNQVFVFSVHAMIYNNYSMSPSWI